MLLPTKVETGRCLTKSDGERIEVAVTLTINLVDAIVKYWIVTFLFLCLSKQLDYDFSPSLSICLSDAATNE